MWLIRKDGMWLMGYRASGIEEFMRDGKLASIPTCLYSERREDAMIFDAELMARNLASLIGADLMVVGKRGGTRKVK